MAEGGTTAQEAMALAEDWAAGRRSWTNLGGLNSDLYPPDVIAVMDAQEVVKWTTIAVARAALSAGATDVVEGREGMVTAYDHDGRYVGCIGRETWRWLIDHPEVDAPALIRAHEMFSAGATDVGAADNTEGRHG